jgi:hypothetical protein
MFIYRRIYDYTDICSYIDGDGAEEANCVLSTYTHTHTHTYIHTVLYVRECIHVNKYKKYTCHIYIYIYIYILIFIYILMYIYTYIYICKQRGNWGICAYIKENVHAIYAHAAK